MISCLLIVSVLVKDIVGTPYSLDKKIYQRADIEVNKMLSE